MQTRGQHTFTWSIRKKTANLDYKPFRVTEEGEKAENQLYGWI